MSGTPRYWMRPESSRSMGSWFLGKIMTHLPLISGMLASALLGLANRSRRESPVVRTPARKMWAEHVAEVTSKNHGRRYESLTQMKVCHGDFDDRLSLQERARRRSRCAKICGLCRYINSLDIWLDPNYRRPPQVVLDAIEYAPYYSPRRTIASGPEDP